MPATAAADSLNVVRLPQFRTAHHRRCLDALQPLRASDRHELYWVGIPDDNTLSLDARSTHDARVSVPVGCFLWALSASSAQPEGFKLQVTDLGTRAALFSQPVAHRNAAGGSGSTAGLSNPLFLLPKPLPIVEPGLLALQIFNLAPAANAVQVVLCIARPMEVLP